MTMKMPQVRYVPKLSAFPGLPFLPTLTMATPRIEANIPSPANINGKLTKGFSNDVTPGARPTASIITATMLAT